MPRRFTLEIGHYPTIPEIRMRSRNDPDFPSHNVFQRQGRKAELAEKVKDYCSDKPEFEEVVRICEPIAATHTKRADQAVDKGGIDGFVYLMKSGKYYKIGFTNSLDRRQYEIGMQLPEGIEPIHSIRTDDPSGIDAYWHGRFKNKRLKGEWFNLTTKDVAIFKKRKFM